MLESQAGSRRSRSAFLLRSSYRSPSSTVHSLSTSLWPRFSCLFVSFCLSVWILHLRPRHNHVRRYPLAARIYIHMGDIYGVVPDVKTVSRITRVQRYRARFTFQFHCQYLLWYFTLKYTGIDEAADESEPSKYTLLKYCCFIALLKSLKNDYTNDSSGKSIWYSYRKAENIIIYNLTVNLGRHFYIRAFFVVSTPANDPTNMQNISSRTLYMAPFNRLTPPFSLFVLCPFESAIFSSRFLTSHICLVFMCTFCLTLLFSVLLYRDTLHSGQKVREPPLHYSCLFFFFIPFFFSFFSSPFLFRLFLSLLLFLFFLFYIGRGI